jgi:hypothetical protein
MKNLLLLIYFFLLSSCSYYYATNGADINNLHATERKCRAMAAYTPITIDNKPVTYDTYVNCNENAGFVNCNATTYGTTSPELGLAEVFLNFLQLSQQDAFVEQCLADHGFINANSIGSHYGNDVGGGWDPNSESNKNSSGGGWDPKNNE